MQSRPGARAAATSAMMLLVISAFAPLPAIALTPGELLQKIIPHSDAPKTHKRSRMKAPAKPAPPPSRPPLPAAKPDIGTAPVPPGPQDERTKPVTPPVPPLPEPSPDNAPPSGAPDQNSAPATPPKPAKASEETPHSEPSPRPAEDMSPAADEPPSQGLPPAISTILPTPPLAEPTPPAGTVIPPADDLGPVIPPVLPPILPPPEPLQAPLAPAKPIAPPPEEKPETDKGPPRPLPDPEELAACRAGLAVLAITAEAEPPLAEGECGAPDPFKVTGFLGDSVTLLPAATIDCAAATALAHWVIEDVQPAARAAFGAPVTKIAVAGSYACRGRNNIAGARLSEHAFMNAIDIGGFTVDGRMIAVTETDGQPAADAAFIATVRKAACARFTTVLGPGSDAEHATHLHLDVLKRGRNGDYRICE